MLKRILFISVFLGHIGLVMAQVTTSNIKGEVLDDQGIPLLGVNVLALHLPTGTSYGVVTNEEGRYNLLNLRVGGPYTVTISYVGFKTQEFTDIYLVLGTTYNVDTQMVLENTALDEVVVTGSQDNIFGGDRTGAQTSIGRRQLNTLPTITRSAADFTRLEPSASNGSFGGRNDQFNNFSLDGAIFNNPFGLDAATPGGQTDAQPISLDAIEQIQVTTAPYDVTQSGFTGASVNAVTKSGTNEFSGTVYGFFRNEDLTGGKIKGEEVFKPKLEQTQYGFAVGGPIVKNKLFFFANFESDQRTDLGSGFVPNRGAGTINESRVLASDFELVDNILRQVVIGQDANGNDIFYDPGRYEGFTYDANSTKGIFKLDWNINDNNRLAIIYNFLDASKEKPAHPTALGFRGPNAATLQFENAGYEINNKLQSIQVELNSTISDKMVNKLQLGYTHFDDFRNPLSSPAPSITIQSGGSNYIIAGHEPFSINNTLDQKVFQATNNFNYFVGDHTITAGVSFEKFEFDNSFNLGAYGGNGVFGPSDIDPGSSINPLTIQIIQSGTFDTLNFFQDLFDIAIASDSALNSAGTGNPGGWALAETNVGQFSAYIQDEWDVTERLKLTLGLRMDTPLYFDSSDKAQEVIDRSCCYVPGIPYYDPETGEEVLFDSTKMPSGSVLFSPRFGFNWDVQGDRSFQIRGGSGIFTGRFPFVWLGNQIANPNVFFYQVVDPDFKWPQVWRTNIGGDYRFQNGLILTGDISYTKDINAAHVQNWGLRPPSLELNGIDTRQIYANEDLVNNGYVFSNSDKGRIWNVTFKGEKTFSNGFYASIAYNFLDSKDVNSIEAEITGDAFAGNAALNNVNDDVLSNSKYGDRHRILGVLSKEWRYGNEHWGTTVSAFFEYAQGGRFSYVYGGDINNDKANSNDLIYIPTNTEIGQMNFATTDGGPTEQEQRAALEQYIQQDDYLSDRRGQYAERYGALAPWRSTWDLRFLQDYHFKVSESKTNTIQFSLTILNFGNLISSDWGLVQVPNNIQPLGATLVRENGDPAENPTGEVVYSFDPDLTSTFGYDTNIISRWQMQLGLRYSF